MQDYISHSSAYIKRQPKPSFKMPIFSFFILGIGLAILSLYLWQRKEAKPISPEGSTVVQSTSKPLLQKIQSIIQKKPERQSKESFVTEVEQMTSDKQGQYGWYVQSLESGETYGSNFDFSYTAASVNKIPITLFFLQSIENKIFNLQDTYVLENQDIESGSGTLQYQKLGSEYSYEDLIIYAGKYSDNTAANAMVRLIGLNTIQKTIDDLGLTNTNINKNTTTPQNMIELLRLVYLDKILKDTNLTDLFYRSLTDTEYEEDRIPEGVPQDVQVAHKIGWQIQVWNDCGIIFSAHPYAICILTDGIAEAEAQEVLPQISHKVWQYESER